MGGPLKLDRSNAILRSTEVSSHIDLQWVTGKPVSLEGASGGLVLSGNNTTRTGPVTMTTVNLGISKNTALGAGASTVGIGCNILISALDGVSPGDLWLRKNLTVYGVVSGNNGIGLLLGGDSTTLTLTNFSLSACFATSQDS